MNDILEYSAVALNIVYVVLAARENIWCWPFGILGSALSIALFVEIKLYAESVLFSYYVIMGVYGWVNWNKSKRERGDIRIRTWTFWSHATAICIGYASTFIIFLVLKYATDAQMPLLDAFTTAFSFIATYMVAQRILENWIYWIAIDALTIYLYTSRGLEVYAWLSAIYTIMAIYGYMQWRHDYKEQPAL